MTASARPAWARTSASIPLARTHLTTRQHSTRARSSVTPTARTRSTPASPVSPAHTPAPRTSFLLLPRVAPPCRWTTAPSFPAGLLHRGLLHSESHWSARHILLLEAPAQTRITQGGCTRSASSASVYAMISAAIFPAHTPRSPVSPPLTRSATPCTPYLPTPQPPPQP